jgi:hypothetical protein
MAFSLRRNRLNQDLGQNRKTARACYRPEIELLESRRLLSLSVGPNVDMSNGLHSGQAEASIAMNPTNPNNLVAFSNTDENTSGVRLYVSNDAGATWSTRLIGHGDGLEVAACCDTQIAFDDFGNLFAVNIDFVAGGNSAIKVLRSSDGGATFVLQATLRTGNVDQPSIATGHGMVWVSFDDGGHIAAAGAPVTGLGQVGAFSALESAPGSTNCSFGNIAIGPAGQVMVTYQSDTGGSGPATIFENVDPDGLGSAGFGNAVTITGTNVGGFDHIPPQMARSVDAEATVAYDRSGGPHNGRVYLVYTDSPAVGSANTDIYERFSDDGGMTWSSRVRVNDDNTTNSQFLPDFAVDQTTGNLAVAFYDSRNAPQTGKGADQTAQLFATVSTDGGMTFEPNVQISTGTSNSATAHSSTDYGDYMTMEFRNNVFYPIWSDNGTTIGNTDLPSLDITTARVTVLSQPANHFSIVATPGTVTAGSSFNLTVTAQDSTGNTLTSYRGTVHFTSSDGRAVLPHDYTFTATDSGVHTFMGVILKTAGSQIVTANDSVNSLTGAATIGVNPAAATHLAVIAPAGATAGAPFSVTVEALDMFNNRANGYRGTVRFSSTDSAATLPGNYTFTSADQGSHTFTNEVTLRTTGNRTITATDRATGSISGNATVNVTAASAATHFTITAPASVSLGVGFNITVTALDANNQVVTNFTGAVHFTSSDTAAILPVDYTFTSADRGVHFFKAVILRTGGAQTITVTDRANSSVTGTASINARRGELIDTLAHAIPESENGQVPAASYENATQSGVTMARDLVFAWSTAKGEAPSEERLLLALTEAGERVKDRNDWDLFSWSDQHL